MQYSIELYPTNERGITLINTFNNQQKNTYRAVDIIIFMGFTGISTYAFVAIENSKDHISEH